MTGKIKKNVQTKHCGRKIYNNTVDFILHWPSTAACGAHPKACFKYPARLHRRKLIFPLQLVASWR